MRGNFTFSVESDGGGMVFQGQACGAVGVSSPECARGLEFAPLAVGSSPAPKIIYP